MRSTVIAMNSTASAPTQTIGALVAMVEKGQLHQAETKIRALLAIHAEDGMLWKILSVALLRQGEDALPALRRAAELMPRDAEAHRNLGAALHDQGQWADALQSLRQALALEPDDADALFQSADAMRGLGGARQAVSLYARALRLKPRLTEAHNNMGNALVELRQFTDAVACYRCALELSPDNAQIHCNLANALRHLKSWDDSIAHTRRALELDPASSAAHHTMGLILSTRGQREAAVASYQQALASNPGYVDALNNLGNALRELGRRREALALYRRAAELAPIRADSHCNIGTVLFEMRQVEGAVAKYREALAIQPDYLPALSSLSLALRQQRRPVEAEESCRAALAIEPDHAEALALLGELRADQGRFAEAQALFERVITVDADFSAAFCGIAMHRKMTGDDGRWLDGVEALLAKRPPVAQEVALRYAAGKYFDDIRQYDSAFSHYHRANELTKQHANPYQGARFTARVDQLVRRFDAAYLERHRPSARSTNLPIFIVGMPRSGTSLAEQILASHPAVFGAGEVIFWSSAYTEFAAAGSSAAADELLAGQATRYLDQLTSVSGGAQRVIDKMPGNFLFAGLIHAAFPRARIIHMRRHPIDTCLSIYFQNFFNVGPYANDLHDLAHYYGEYVRVTDHWRSVLPEGTLLEVPYEALIEDPERWIRRMLEFVALPWDARCLDFHRTERTVLTASKWQVRQAINRSSAGRWRNYESHVGPLRRLIEAGAA